MTPLHRHSETKNTGELKIVGAGTLKDYVNAIREVAEYYSLPVVDIYSMGGIHPQLESNRIALCPDCLHPNDAGHKKVAALLEGFLKTL